jgi:predicted nucleic acid-binding protein
MNDLTKLSNEQLGDFIQISLIHGTNTQFSYELLHEVASRLKHTDEIIKAGISNGIHDTLTKQSTAFKFRLEDVVQTLDDALAPESIEDTKETVEMLTIDITSYEAMDKAVKEAFEEEAVEEVPVKKEPKKKEKPNVKESLTVETLQPVEIVEETPVVPSITAEALKTKALEMRQKNTISRDAITAKLAEYGATTILKLDPTVYNEFNAFLESHNV